MPSDYGGLHSGYHSMTDDLDIQVWVGRTADLYDDWHTLMCEWTVEETGEKLDSEAWATEMLGQVQSPGFAVIVAYDGDMAVGFVEAMAWRASAPGVFMGRGDHAYVSPEYRDQGVYEAIFDAGYNYLTSIGVEKIQLPVSKGHGASWLRPFYEGRGFRETEIIMEKDLRPARPLPDRSQVLERWATSVHDEMRAA